MLPILKAVIGWLGDFSAIFVADKAAGAGEPRNRTAAAVIETARKIAEAEKFDRPEFLMELQIINADTNGEVQPILDLFDEFWKKKSIVWVGAGKKRRSYRENQVGHLLQMVPIDHRQTEYVRLARLLGTSKEKFFSQLEILNDDRFQQVRRQFVAEFEESTLGKSIATSADEIADPLEAITAPGGSLRNLRDRLRARATR